MCGGRNTFLFNEGRNGKDVSVGRSSVIGVMDSHGKGMKAENAEKVD